jgi:hypothetical protein
MTIDPDSERDEGIDYIGREAHRDAIDFISGLNVPGQATDEIYAAALGDERTAIVGDLDLEGKLDTLAALHDVAALDRPTTADEYMEAIEDAGRRTGVDVRKGV